MKKQQGYSLIEVIIAFALLAVALTLLLGSLSGAAKQVRVSGSNGRAALYAQSLLAEQGVAEPLQPGRSSGSSEDGRYHWQLQVQPYQDPHLAPGTSPGPVSLMQLDLRISWDDPAGHELHWQTLRLVPSNNLPGAQ